MIPTLFGSLNFPVSCVAWGRRLLQGPHVLYASGVRPELEDVLTRGGHREGFAACADVPAWLIYGAGNKGRALATFLRSHGRTVAGFIDRRRVALPDATVWTTESALSGGAPQVPVLIGVHSPGAPVAPIKAQLLAEGFTSVWTLPEVIDTWPALRHFWLAPSSALTSRGPELGAAFDRLADEASRALFLALIRQRLLGDFAGLPEPDVANQYHPADLPSLPKDLAFIDCGAYVGDTVTALRAAGHTLTRLAAFEPDLANFKQLTRVASGVRGALFPCGVWHETTQLRFSSDDAAGHVSETGDLVVPVVALDEVLPDFQPDFIKLDVEGAEPRALDGARGMIAASRPRLAVSAYHEPEHLFSLLLQLDGWALGYRFFLRSHAHNGFDTVLYAVPS